MKTYKSYILSEVDYDAGDYFRLPQKEPGQVFKFLGVQESEDGRLSVCAYGGSRDPRGRRGFRAFFLHEHFVKAKAPYQKRGERDGE